MLIVMVVSAGLAACGGGGEEVATGSTESTESTVEPTSTAPTSTRDTVVRRRLPGPPGPLGPGTILDAIAIWHPLMEAGVPGGNCRPLLEAVLGPLGKDVAQEVGGPPYVALYKGIAEGCLGRLGTARHDLLAARQVGLGPDETSTDRTCNAQELLAFGFATYLNQNISPTCPKPTTTTRAPTSTTRDTTTTSRATSTTQASTSTSRTSTPTTR